MIGPDQLRVKAHRLFPKAIKAWLDGATESLFPYRIPANLTPSKDHSKAIAEVESLRDQSKQTIGSGYRVEWKSRRSRTHGLNDFPGAIFIDTMDDLVALTKRESEWVTLQVVAGVLRNRQPALEGWLRKGANWKALLELSEVLPDLLTIVDYFVENPRPDCFARELPIAVSTKLIEQHRRRLAIWLDAVLPPDAIDVRFGHDQFEPRYGLRYARPHYLLRILDTELQRVLGLPFAELSLPAESLNQLPAVGLRVIIVENKISLLSLPPLPGTIALGGLGNGVTQLQKIAWLSESEVTYWGDLDADGFRILDRIRGVLPAVRSQLMDETIIERFRYLATDGNGDAIHETKNLNSHERRCYQLLCEQNLRIEQEHLPFDLVHSVLARSDT